MDKYGKVNFGDTYGRGSPFLPFVGSEEVSIVPTTTFVRASRFSLVSITSSLVLKSSGQITFAKQ